MRKRIAIAVGAVALSGFVIPINKSLLEPQRTISSDIQTSLLLGGSRIQTVAASNQISATNPVALVKGSGGAVTLTSAPTIADGTDGQLIMLFGMDDTNTVTVQDQGTLASSNLILSASTRTLGQGDALLLMYHNAGNPRSVPPVTNSNWYEISSSSAVTVTTAFSTAVKTLTVSDSPYTVLVSDYTLNCNATGGAITVNLPAATGSGRILAVKKTDSSANAITIDGSGSETIDGSTTTTLDIQYVSVNLQDAATGVWYIH